MNRVELCPERWVTIDTVNMKLSNPIQSYPRTVDNTILGQCALLLYNVICAI